MLLKKDGIWPVDSKNGPTFKNPIIGLGDTSLNVRGLGIYKYNRNWALFHMTGHRPTTYTCEANAEQHQIAYFV